MNSRIKGWLHQPTTIHGIGVLTATAVGVGAYYVTGSSVTAAGLAGSAFGVIATLMNDANADKSRVEALVSDAVIAIATQHLGPMLPQLAADASRALRADATVIPPTASTAA